MKKYFSFILAVIFLFSTIKGHANHIRVGHNLRWMLINLPSVIPVSYLIYFFFIATPICIFTCCCYLQLYLRFFYYKKEIAIFFRTNNKNKYDKDMFFTILNVGFAVIVYVVILRVYLLLTKQSFLLSESSLLIIILRIGTLFFFMWTFIYTNIVCSDSKRCVFT